MHVPSNRRDLYRDITDNIIRAIEAGVERCERPWSCPGLGLPINASTTANYRGVNVIALWAAAMERGYHSSMWASYKQWQSLGAQVRKAERGSLIVFYKRAEERTTEAEDDTQNRLRFTARASHVFNAQQVDGFAEPVVDLPAPFATNQQAEAFVAAVGATIRHGFPMARYRRDLDEIEMPAPSWFKDTASSPAQHNYYAVLLHELTHWTGAPQRLSREMGKRFGDEAYAMEELVAELGAAFACSALGITSEPRPDHAAYVSSWLSVLRRDSRAIFAAGSKAQEAFEHLAYLATRVATT